MRLLSLRLEGYRQFADPVRIEFGAGLTGICGPNGVGKSKLVEAIGFALYGPSGSILPPGDHKRDLPSHVSAGAEPRVELRLEVRDQVLRLVRSINTASLELEGEAMLAETPSGVTTKITELLRLSPAAYAGTFVARQRDVAGLQSPHLGPKDRQRLVNRLIGISQIETAIELAQDERRTRAQGLALAEAAVTTPPAEAESRHAEASLQLRDAEDAAASIGEELDGTVRRQASAREHAEAARLARERARGLQVQIDELNEHTESLDRQIEAAEARVSSAATAAGEHEKALLVVSDTESLEQEKSALEQARRASELKNELGRAEADLANVAGEAAHRERLLAKLGEAKDRVVTTQDELAAVELELGVKQQEHLAAREQLAGIQRRSETAEELGEEGECEVCGQRYGPGLKAALAHFQSEIAAADGRVVELTAEEAAILLVLDKRKDAAGGAVAAQEDVEGSIAELEDVPGRLAALKSHIEKLTGELSAMGEGIPAFNPDGYREVEEGLAERSRATAALERLRPLVDDGPIATDLLDTLVHEKEELSTRRAEVETDLQAAYHEAEEGTAAMEELQAATDGEKSARNRSLEQAQVVASWQTTVQQAEVVQEGARQQARDVEVARRRLLVSERAAELLGRLLTEVTEEARPRLADLMDGWGRSLLGTRFRGVTLTEDYKVQADNGSGWHDITHFSGGEQTVLSVMLRVAISIFCRERAGFETGFLILDEIFGDQDSEHRVLLLEFLAEIQRQYHQVLVVNHVDDVTAMLDSIIDVTPTGANTSTAAYRQ